MIGHGSTVVWWVCALVAVWVSSAEAFPSFVPSPSSVSVSSLSPVSPSLLSLHASGSQQQRQRHGWATIATRTTSFSTRNRHQSPLAQTMVVPARIIRRAMTSSSSSSSSSSSTPLSSSSSSLSLNQTAEGTVSSTLVSDQVVAAAVVVDNTDYYSTSTSSSSSSSSPSLLVQNNNQNNSNKHQQQQHKNIPFPIVLWRLARPHTLIGSAVAIPSLHLFAAPSWSAALVHPRTWYSIVACWIPSLLMNLYITGLNQITDVDIDRINKPNLVLAAGLLRKSTAVVIVLTALLISLSWGHWPSWLGAHQSLRRRLLLLLPCLSTPGLQLCLWGSALLGTLYSLPPVRLKRFPVGAAFCIVAVRGTIINAGFFAHAHAVANAAGTATDLATVVSSSSSSSLWSSWRSVRHVLLQSPACFWSSLFFAVFGMVIALMKDVPDVLGDRLSDIRTLSVRWGPTNVFQWSHRLLTTLFAVVGVRLLLLPLMTTTMMMTMTIPITTTLSFSWGRAVAGLASFLAAWSVQQQARTVAPESSTQVYQYYMHLWKLFYLSYLILPLAQ